MTQPAGEPVGDMKWLVLRLPVPPNTVLQLGTVLSEPENVESFLNRDEIPTIGQDDRLDMSNIVKLHLGTELKKEDHALASALSKFPAFVDAGASADAHREHTTSTTVDALQVKAEVLLQAAKEYMPAALKTQGVLDYLRGCYFRKPLYMVVGVATAGRYARSERQERSSGAGASGHADVPGIAGGDTELRHERGANADVELEVEDECVFAYRIRQFSYMKLLGLRDGGDRTQKAMFDPSQSGPAAREDEVEFAKFVRQKPEDFESLTGM
ncbi:hypothetical protein diail_3531, partial [Diaporthe ilicicola]